MKWIVVVPEFFVSSISVNCRGIKTILDDIGVSRNVANDVSLDVRVSCLPLITVENLDNWDLRKNRRNNVVLKLPDCLFRRNWVKILAGAGSVIKAHEDETIVYCDSVSFDKFQILVGSILFRRDVAVAELRVCLQIRTDLSEIFKRIAGSCAVWNSRGMFCLGYFVVFRSLLIYENLAIDVLFNPD